MTDIPPQFSTPMMQQYMRIKGEHLDALLMYRLGDFYELFLDDALVGAKVLQITLTRRPRGKDGDIPMAGVPYHAADRYIAKLVKAGYKVAICEQVSEPDSKGIVDREVIRIVTPGTILDEQSLEQKEHNYIMSIIFRGSMTAFAAADISTGDFYCGEYGKDAPDFHTLKHILLRFKPAECLLNHENYNNPEVLGFLKNHGVHNCVNVPQWDDFTSRASAKLLKQFRVATLKSIGIDSEKHAIEATSALLGYVSETQRGHIEHLTSLKRYTSEDSVVLDESTVSNLELFATLQGKGSEGSLIHAIDHTVSGAGGRMLREWVKQPLRSLSEIEERQKAVQELLHNLKLRTVIREKISEMYDIERILARIATGIGNAADLVNLKTSLSCAIEALKHTSTMEHLPTVSSSTSSKIKSITELIDKHIQDTPPLDIRGGNIIKDGVDAALDDLRAVLHGGKSHIEVMEEREKESTGITTLKIRFNKVFGYYIEVSKSYVETVPSHYMRKQTLVNAERFMTPELKEYEERIMTAQATSEELEYQLFLGVVRKVEEISEDIQHISRCIAQIDCLSTFAHNAHEYRYVQPKIVTTGQLAIADGRHPVLEQLMENHTFVPNSVLLDQTRNQLHIITGPNMAGKSVYMRQVALITLLAHIGAYVPAREATISIVDRIFVRSGASDMITSGLSTFMVEMVETAHILQYATSKSLIILDEIGRGTSTYDGVSIAWAVADYLVTQAKKGPKTLFAAHYHELQKLEMDYPDRISNYHMAIEDHKGVPIFLYHIVEGPASHSYGIAVAQLAGVPENVIIRARTILQGLESSTDHASTDGISKLEKALKSLNLDSLTPVEALSYLADVQKKLR